MRFQPRPQHTDVVSGSQGTLFRNPFVGNLACLSMYEHLHELRSMRNSVLKALLACSTVIFVGCSGDAENNEPAPTNQSTPDAGPSDSGDLDATTDPDASESDSGEDAGEVSCTTATIEGLWELTYADDVSIEYSANVSPDIEGDSRQLSLLFERYSPIPDVGSFDLSMGSNDNFGTCPRCLFVRTDGPERAYFQAEGTLESGVDPYGRRLDITVSNLRLIEVEVDGTTRESTPIEGGRCIEFETFSTEGVYPPSTWTCNPQNYNDDTNCDCSCGAVDPDCGIQQCALGDTSCDMEPTELPVVGCNADQVCAFDPATFSTECVEPCDWNAQEGCTNGTCVFDFGTGDGDLCITDALRVAPAVQVGEDCPDTAFQIVCDVSNGFAQGYCGPNGVCRSVCTDDAECTEDGHTCRAFTVEDPLGYCGPVPVDPDG